MYIQDWRQFPCSYYHSDISPRLQLICGLWKDSQVKPQA